MDEGSGGSKGGRGGFGSCGYICVSSMARKEVMKHFFRYRNSDAKRKRKKTGNAYKSNCSLIIGLTHVTSL